MWKATRAAEEPHVRAQVRATRTALMALETGAARIERGLGADLEPLDLRSDFDDRAGNLVAQYQRLAHREVAHRAAMVVVQVRAADASISDGHPDFTDFERPILDRIDAQILLPVT